MQEVKGIKLQPGAQGGGLKLLDTALKMDPNCLPDEVTGNKVAQRTGRQLWNTITGKDYPEK